MYKRQTDYRARQKQKGMIFMQKWVTPAEKAAIESLLAAMRTNKLASNDSERRDAA